MKSLWDPRAEDELMERVARLAPDAPPRWGRFTCPQMVVHVTDAFRLYTGELNAAATHTPFRYSPFKQALIYLLPIPRNVPTAPELIARVPADWPVEVTELRDAMSRFAAQRTRADWPPHPIFGRMSCRAYGVLAYKHTDHHLRQFGV